MNVQFKLGNAPPCVAEVPPSAEELFAHTSGPRSAEVILIGEAWGSEEERARRPFVGSSGKELDRILHDAGLSRDRVLCTNVVHSRPPGNDFSHFLNPTKGALDAAYRGTFPRPELRAGISLLHHLIHAVRPKLLIAAGNWPLFALSEMAEVKTAKGYKLPGGITKWRGSQARSIEIHGHSYPLLPIIHPASILREWGFRAVTVQDLRRAANFLSGKTEWEARPSAHTLHKPTYAQILGKLAQWRWKAAKGPLELAVDIETKGRKFIDVVGLADAESEICIPLFHVETGQTKNYMELQQEWLFWEALKGLLEHENVRIIGQNFIYDTEWFYRYYNIRALVSFDTMVAHHLLFPGTPKRLDYLASLYCKHYLYWKDESQDADETQLASEVRWKYNCKDLRATYEIAQVLKAALAQQKLEPLYAERLDQWRLSREMMLKGISFDLTLQKVMKLQLNEEASQISQWLLNAVPEFARYTSTGKPWYDSPKGTAELLYRILGLNPILHKKTKQPTTDDTALAELSERPACKWILPILERLRHLRSLGVFLRTILSARPSPDGRMRCSFNIAHPETFRWSSNSNGFSEGTNLQNISKGEE